MADRKESLKKSLGIPEYPWSSDEEDTDAAQPNISTATLRPFDNAMQRAPRDEVVRSTSSTSLFQPSTSTPNPIPTTSASGLSAAARERVDRNLFWSLVCHPNTTQVDIVQRQANLEAEAASARLMVRPSSVNRRPELMRPRMSPLRGIQSILAKNKRRPITSARDVPFPSTSLSQPNMFTGPPRGAQLHVRRNALFEPQERNRRPHMCFMPNPPSRSADEPQPSTSGASAVRRQLFDRDLPADDGPETIDVDVSNNTDDGGALDNDPEDDTDALDAGPSNVNESPNASMEISLEEEVLEVEPQETPETRSDESGNNESGEPPAAANEAAAETAQDESRGVKRKRDDSVSAEEANRDDSVKELNQCLLRLLECPVCLEWMEPPMSQCRRGHLVCVKCRARLSSCPVCRTTFSSVRNRAMEGVAEMLRYPCRHGCAREVRLRRRASHEANCARRRYPCPAPACAARHPLPHNDLPHHFQTKHASMVKLGRKQKFSVKVNAEQHDNWIIMAMHEIFHLRIDVDIRTWGVTIYVAFVGPKNVSRNYMYEVTVVGKHNQRKLIYTRATHSDLESASLNVCRQDCFHLSLDQALNFLRIKNRHCETDNSLNVSVTIMKNEVEADREDSCDS